MAERKLLRGYKALSEKLGGRSRTQIWRNIKAGLLPPPIELGPNSVAWFDDEIDSNVASRPRRIYEDPGQATA